MSLHLAASLLAKSPSLVTFLLPVIPLCQGNTNGCGTTALAMALNCLEALQSDKTPIPRYTRTQLDQHYRRLDSFCAPGMLIRTACQLGFSAALYNHSSFAEIACHLAQGHTILALARPAWKEKWGNLHYLFLHGYTHTPETQTLIFTDPATGQTQTQPFREFAPRWEHLTLDLGPLKLPTGFNRPILVFAWSPTVLPSRKLPFTSPWATALNDILNQVPRHNAKQTHF